MSLKAFTPVDESHHHYCHTTSVPFLTHRTIFTVALIPTIVNTNTTREYLRQLAEAENVEGLPRTHQAAWITTVLLKDTNVPAGGQEKKSRKGENLQRRCRKGRRGEGRGEQEEGENVTASAWPRQWPMQLLVIAAAADSAAADGSAVAVAAVADVAVVAVADGDVAAAQVLVLVRGCLSCSSQS